MSRNGRLGVAIRARRLELGLSQEQLAQRSSDAREGILQSDISRLESGQVALPRSGHLRRIAAALDMPIVDLLARSGWAAALVASADAPADPDAANPLKDTSPAEPG
jgi:transcriptional regulator with XRE-family HTH domain